MLNLDKSQGRFSYGKRGSEKRTAFDIKAKSFASGELIREERK